MIGSDDGGRGRGTLKRAPKWSEGHAWGMPAKSLQRIPGSMVFNPQSRYWHISEHGTGCQAVRYSR